LDIHLWTNHNTSNRGIFVDAFCGLQTACILASGIEFRIGRSRLATLSPASGLQLAVSSMACPRGRNYRHFLSVVGDHLRGWPEVFVCTDENRSAAGREFVLTNEVKVA
jgi:hypothetical protein